MFVTAAWVGNRVIHLPSQLNTHQPAGSQVSLRWVPTLNCSFADGSAQAKGYALPYPNFVTDFGGSATVAQALSAVPAVLEHLQQL